MFEYCVSRAVKLLTLTAIVFALLLTAVQSATANSKYAAMVIDANSGKTLYFDSGYSLRYPASLTKVMTLYIVFEELQAGRLKKSDKIRFSKRAAQEPPSKLGLSAGQTITVDNAIRALVTKSANDVARAVGEHISGSESRFARRMTRTARRLGMKRTTFRNASGLPDRRQRTTASDMIKLALAVQQDYPRYYKYFSLRSFSYRSRRYGNHNRLLGHVRGVDGIKTGYTRDSGFNLMTSVRSRGRHIVAVVLGGRTANSRNRHMTDLVARYLPRGTTQPTRLLVKNRQPTQNQQIASAGLPKTKPQSVQQNLNSTTNRPINIADLVALSSFAETPDELGPIVPIYSQAESRNLSLLTTASNGSIATSQVANSGWQIQIGALDSMEAANKLLSSAKKHIPPSLGEAFPYPQKIERNGRIFFRARFTGFESKNSARLACKKFKQKRMDCFTIYN